MRLFASFAGRNAHRLSRYRIIPILLASLCASAAMAQAPATPSSGADACESFAAALHAAGDTEVASGQSMAEVAAAAPGSTVRSGDRLDDYELRSDYVGSLSCQNAHLFQTTAAGTAEISVPPEFAPAEGSHCTNNDRVRLISIDGVPGLMGELIGFAGAGQSATIGISMRAGDQWSSECFLRVTTRASYEAAVASCAGNDCGPLTALAEQSADANHRALNGQALPSVSQLSPDQQAQYADMITIAARQHIASSTDVPFFGDGRLDREGTSGCQINFDNLGGRLFPIVSGSDVLVGKIGHDGFGSGRAANGPNAAVAMYRLAQDALQPIAGFCVVPKHQVIDSISVLRDRPPMKKSGF